ncbi:MAG: hypothetical protein VX600_04990 [Candidatus Neomarinimicrobiota bacterium]|uniref:Uncharacterized protein n=1 Tax=marine metagenome TaxID=408172 RepID=A0A381ZIM3_9ZZZZ|nr:hypothetical protein [Candidatus Neomarinimicrobiota bacterium]
MPVQTKKSIRTPTEKQINLLEILMVHELEDVQKKALAIVLHIWKKKSVQEISYIIPDLSEKQIRYTMKRYRSNPTQYLQALNDRWSKRRMVHELRSAHDKWAKRHQGKKTFDLSIRGFFHRYNKPLLAQLQNLGKNKLFITAHDAYAEAGINPNCHLPVSYGTTDQDERENWVEVLTNVAETFGERILVSHYMNPADKGDRKSIRIPDIIRYPGTDFPLSEAEKTPELRISLISIQKEGVHLFGTKDMESHEECWTAAVNAAGFEYKIIQESVAAATRKKFVLMFLDYLVEHKFEWNPDIFKKPEYDYINYFYKGLKDTWDNSLFREHAHADDILLGSLMEAYYYHEGEPSSPHQYYQDNMERIIKDIYKEENLGKTWTFNYALQGIFRKYSDGERITRSYLEAEEKDQEFLNEMTSLGKGNYAHFMNIIGLPISQLDSLYHDELDDPWKIEVLYENVRRLIEESLNTGENRLLGKYASQHEKKLYRAMCMKYGHWTGGLSKVGVELKAFTKQLNTHNSLRSGFHTFFHGLLKRYDFNELDNPKRVKKDGQFTCEKTLKDCTPEYYFWDKIIETRLGFHKNEPQDHIEKLKNHTGMIILLAPDGDKERISGETVVLRISFSQFVKESKSLLGVQIRHSEMERLSNKLKRKSFWD